MAETCEPKEVGDDIPPRGTERPAEAETEVGSAAEAPAAGESLPRLLYLPLLPGKSEAGRDVGRDGRKFPNKRESQMSRGQKRNEIKKK